MAACVDADEKNTFKDNCLLKKAAPTARLPQKIK